jgi:hypothetical protein
MTLKLFIRAISTKRAADSIGEAQFVAHLAHVFGVTMIDGVGNLHFDRRGNSRSRTLFVAHTDTISHGKGIVNPWIVDKEGVYSVKEDTLGADDGAGIALLGHLMDNNVPGYYIFCRGEECGGIGSMYLAKEHSSLLSEFDRAIAFDRAGFSDVITHQMGGRCASDEFAAALVDELNDQGLLYMPSDGGVFTDTANFIDIIPECTNISVGYECQHGKHETQDSVYLCELGDAIVRIDWDALPTERDPDNVDELPPIRSTDDQITADAWQAALDKDPRALMREVAKLIGVAPARLDEEAFLPAEVYTVAMGTSSWEDVLYMLADMSFDTTLN